MWCDGNVAFFCETVSLDSSYRNEGLCHPGCAWLDPFNWLDQRHRAVLEAYFGLTSASIPARPRLEIAPDRYRTMSRRAAAERALEQLVRAARACEYEVPDLLTVRTAGAWVRQLWDTRPLASWYGDWAEGSQRPPHGAP